MVLTARAEAAPSGDPDALDLFALSLDAHILHADSGLEYLLLADGPFNIRFELRGDSVARGPVRLHYDIGGFRSLRANILLLARLEALGRRGRLPAALFPPDPVANRRHLALDAWDRHRAGASQIEIAIALFGDDSVTGESFDLMRKRVARLIELAQRQSRISYQRFFGG